MSQGKHVIALLHDNPGDIPASKTEHDPALLKRLAAFREKASNCRLVKYWKTPSEVKEKAVVALTHAAKRFPSIGWIRADKAASTELLAEIDELRKENAKLINAIAILQQESKYSIPDIAGLDEPVSLHLLYCAHCRQSVHKAEIQAITKTARQ